MYIIVRNWSRTCVGGGTSVLALGGATEVTADLCASPHEIMCW